MSIHEREENTMGPYRELEITCPTSGYVYTGNVLYIVIDDNCFKFWYVKYDSVTSMQEFPVNHKALWHREDEPAHNN